MGWEKIENGFLLVRDYLDMKHYMPVSHQFFLFSDPEYSTAVQNVHPIRGWRQQCWKSFRRCKINWIPFWKAFKEVISVLIFDVVPHLYFVQVISSMKSKIDGPDNDDGDSYLLKEDSRWERKPIPFEWKTWTQNSF